MDFPGRYIIINPSSSETFQARLSDMPKHDEASIKAIISSIPTEEQAAELSTKVIVNDDIETAAKSLSEFIYEKKTTEDDADEGDDDVKEADEMQVDEAPVVES